jgi:hypothetical protein
VLIAGAVELKAALLDLESRPEQAHVDNKPSSMPVAAVEPSSKREAKAVEKVAKGKPPAAPNPVSLPENRSKAVKG